MTLRAIQKTEIGLFGKLPARGDFVRIGLPVHFVEPWDAWLQEVIAASRARMGESWLPAYLESPVWRFVLPAGMCGPGTVIGVVMPSVDRVGRYFPLTLAAVIAADGLVPPDDAARAWLDVCEAAGRAALEVDLAPEQVLQRLPVLLGSGATPAPQAATWWTDGGPRVPPTRLSFAAMPDPMQFAAMLGEGAVAQEGA
jgi:type VI secretion system protein ImpM